MHTIYLCVQLQIIKYENVKQQFKQLKTLNSEISKNSMHFQNLENKRVKVKKILSGIKTKFYLKIVYT